MGIRDWAQNARTWVTSRIHLGGQEAQDSAVSHNPLGGSTGFKMTATSRTKKVSEQQAPPTANGSMAYPSGFSGMQPPVMPDYVAQGYAPYPPYSGGYAPYDPGMGYPPYPQGTGYPMQTDGYSQQMAYGNATGYQQPTGYQPAGGYQPANGYQQPMGYPPAGEYAPQDSAYGQGTTSSPTTGYNAPAYAGQPQQPPASNVTYPAFPGASEGTKLPLIRITQLHSVQQCYRIIEFMRDREVLVVNTEPIASDQEVQRCVDMISGAAFTLSCSLTRITRAERAYLIVPSGMDALAEYQFHGMTDQDVVRRSDQEQSGQSRLGSVAGRYLQQESHFAPERTRRSTAQMAGR